jgi:hypothetical protein
LWFDPNPFLRHVPLVPSQPRSGHLDWLVEEE